MEADRFKMGIALNYTVSTDVVMLINCHIFLATCLLSQRRRSPLLCVEDNILHCNFQMTNYQLYDMTVSPLCLFCNLHISEYFHLSLLILWEYECPQVRQSYIMTIGSCSRSLDQACEEVFPWQHSGRNRFVKQINSVMCHFYPDMRYVFHPDII